MAESAEPTVPEPPVAKPGASKPTVKERLEKLLNDFGPIVLVVHLTLFALTLAGFVVAMSLGFHVQGTAGRAGLLGAAYLATELTKLPRFAATVALTPWVASRWRKLREKRTPTG